MKKIILFLFGSVFALNVVAQDLAANTTTTGDWKNKYCAELKDGKLTVMNDGKALTSDVTLDNGTVISLDGNVVQKDGTKSMLKTGECVGKDGKMVDHMKDKNMKEEPKNKE